MSKIGKENHDYEEEIKGTTRRLERRLKKLIPELERESKNLKRRNVPEDSMEAINLRGTQMFANNCMEFVKILKKEDK